MGDAGRKNCDVSGTRMARMYNAGIPSLSGKEGERMMIMEKVAMRIMNANLKRSVRLVLGSQYLKRSMERPMDVDISSRAIAERAAVTRAVGQPLGTHCGTGSGGPGTCWRC